jgi:hypothetical protein
MHQIVLAIAAALALLSAGAAGTTTQANAGVGPAHANQPVGLRPMDSFPPTGL